MIWLDGELVTADRARIPVVDAALQHGVGLFETMRVIGGAVPLWERHLARLRRSGVALGLDVAGARLPSREELGVFLRTNGLETGVVRLTVSGGFESRAPVSWLMWRAMPEVGPGGVRIEGRFCLADDDEMARHKTLNQWRRRRLMESCRAVGVDERIGVTSDGRIWEAIWANLFVVRGGVVETPTLEGPVLPGVMRGLVIERAAEAGIPVQETDLRDLDGEEVFLTNAVRGVIPVWSCEGRIRPAPGPITRRLQSEIEGWLAEEAKR